jgi:ADP-ribose pyrophosphatase YjhB (NUDIX family)
MIRIAAVLLLDARGWLLLQERDEHAPIDPDVWGMVGGHVEDGEDFEPAAYRELEEETGIRLRPGDLTLWRDEVHEWPGRDQKYHYNVWVAATDLTDGDIVLGEGRQIVFVDPRRLPELDLARSARHFALGFLASDEHPAVAGPDVPFPGRDV